MMQLIESGESRGKERPGKGGKNEEKRRDTSNPQSLRDSRAVENVRSSSLHPPPESTVSRKRRG